MVSILAAFFTLIAAIHAIPGTTIAIHDNPRTYPMISEVDIQCKLATQKKTVNRFIDGYNTWDIESIMAYRAPDCEHQALPSSMKRAAKNNDEYRRYFDKIMPLFANFTVKVHKEIHAAEACVSIIHASSDAQTGIGRYTNEYMIFFAFTEDGEKMKRIEEFADSAYSQAYFKALGLLK